MVMGSCSFFPFMKQLHYRKNNLQSWQAPTIQWGKFKGVVLPEGEESIWFLRYEMAAHDWTGNLNNLQCYKTKKDNEPIRPGSLGVFTPEAFGCDYTSSSDFMEANSCGHVTKECWASNTQGDANDSLSCQYESDLLDVCP